MRYAWLTCLFAVQAAWAQPSEIAGDERVVLFPALGHRVDGGRSWSIGVHGWVFEDKWTDLSLRAMERLLDLDDVITDPEQRKLLRKRLGPFVVDSERHKRAKIVVGERAFISGLSGENGHFAHHFEMTAEEVAWIRAARREPPGRLSYRIETRPGDKRVFAGRVHLLEPRGVSVITDIDDTIRVSDVRDRKAMLVNTFLRPFEAVPGMADAYAEWARRYGAEFHYVSATPYQFYEPLAEFLSANRFPEGTFHLKSIRLKDRTVLELFESPEDFKPPQIEPILKLFPERTFVCVGDSGEKDPEVYGALARQYPQIRRILIRNVSDDGPESPRYARAFRGLTAGSWKVFKDAAEIRELGLAVATSTAPADVGK